VRLRQEFKRQNLSGTRKLSRSSVRKYEQTLEDFIRSLDRHGCSERISLSDRTASAEKDTRAQTIASPGITLPVRLTVPALTQLEWV
jgi:hypothetical protein